jgi:hypothetical protein
MLSLSKHEDAGWLRQRYPIRARRNASARTSHLSSRRGAASAEGRGSRSLNRSGWRRLGPLPSHALSRALAGDDMGG